MVLSAAQAVVPHTVLRARQAMSPDSSMSSVGVPTRSVTMAKKRSRSRSCEPSAAPDAFGLGDGVQALVVPGEGDRIGQSGYGGGLFAEGGAVPGEVGPLDDGFAVGGEAQLGRAAAQRVVGVAPAGAVRCGRPR